MPLKFEKYSLPRKISFLSCRFLRSGCKPVGLKARTAVVSATLAYFKNWIEQETQILLEDVLCDNSQVLEMYVKW